jgi:hypothetical protein
MGRNKILTVRSVETARAGRHNDGDGLNLIVDPSGAKRWLVYLFVKGQNRRREMGLGSYPEVMLPAAREAAARNRAAASRGEEPAAGGDWCSFSGDHRSAS